MTGLENVCELAAVAVGGVIAGEVEEEPGLVGKAADQFEDLDRELVPALCTDTEVTETCGAGVEGRRGDQAGVLCREYTYGHVSAAIDSLATGDGKDLRGGDVVCGHEARDLGVSNKERAGPVGDGVGAENVVEVCMRDEGEVGSVDICGAEPAGCGTPGALSR